MANRLNNDFQFVDVGRQDPQKKMRVSVPKNLPKFTSRTSRMKRLAKRTAACTAATRIASGNARCTTTSPTGCSWWWKAILLKPPSFRIRPTRCPKCAAGFAHRTVCVKATVRLTTASVRSPLVRSRNTSPTRPSPWAGDRICPRSHGPIKSSDCRCWPCGPWLRRHSGAQWRQAGGVRQVP